MIKGEKRLITNRDHCPRIKRCSKLWVTACPKCGQIDEDEDWRHAVRTGVIHYWCSK